MTTHEKCNKTLRIHSYPVLISSIVINTCKCLGEYDVKTNEWNIELHEYDETNGVIRFHFLASFI